MLKVLGDYVTIDDIDLSIGSGSPKCITNLFATLSSDDYNAELIKLLNTNKFMLTLDYLGNRLDRPISPLYQRMIDAHNNGITYANSRLVRVIENKYLFNWNKLANALFADYNPINNYDMVERKKINVNTEINTNSEVSSEASSKDDISSTEKVTQKYAGFNTGASLPTLNETDKTGNTNEEKSESSNVVSESSNTGASKTNEQEEELTRSGNIGVTTSQQMIESEFKLREKNLLEVIYADMDEILFLDYYL